MKSVQDLAEEIVAREGGFVNDPDDPGGATNFGVTLNTLRRLGIDVTRDTRIDVADVQALSRPQAVQIFIEHYLPAHRHRPHCPRRCNPACSTCMSMPGPMPSRCCSGC